MATPPPDVPAATPAPLPASIEPHVRPLWRYLRMLGANATEAEDLAQEAFVLAVQKRAIAAEPPALATFLRRSARFLFLHARRAGARERAVADAVDELWRRGAEVDGGDAWIEAARQCVDSLDGRARRAIELGYGFGDGRPRSRAELAAALGLQENGVKTLMQRLRARLRACIERRIEP